MVVSSLLQRPLSISDNEASALRDKTLESCRRVSGRIFCQPSIFYFGLIHVVHRRVLSMYFGTEYFWEEASTVERQAAHSLLKEQRLLQGNM